MFGWGARAPDESARIREFVAHAATGPKATKRIELDPPSDGGIALREYQIQNSVDDGFTRLYTSLGHRYWIAQAQCGYRCPDWKVHVSVELEDVPRAWDIVAQLFVARRCTSAMKAVNLTASPPEFMRGRELTLYVYRYDRRFDAGSFYDPMASNCRKALGLRFEQSCEYWLGLIDEVERALEVAAVRPAGLAKGDFRLGDCRYCSLRNEAFVRVPARIVQGLSPDEEAFQRSFRAARGWSYPPNVMGHNAAGHRNPLVTAKRRRVLPLALLVLAAWATAELVRRGRGLTNSSVEMVASERLLYSAER